MDADSIHTAADGVIELLRYVIVIAVAVGCVRDTAPWSPVEWKIARLGVIALGVAASVSWIARWFA